MFVRRGVCGCCRSLLLQLLLPATALLPLLLPVCCHCCCCYCRLLRSLLLPTNCMRTRDWRNDGARNWRINGACSLTTYYCNCHGPQALTRLHVIIARLAFVSRRGSPLFPRALPYLLALAPFSSNWPPLGLSLIPILPSRPSSPWIVLGARGLPKKNR